MTTNDLRTAALKTYYPALFLERILPKRKRQRLIAAGWSLLAVSFLLVLVVSSLSRFHISPIFAIALPKTYGLFFICLSLWMVAIALQGFYNSFYYKDVPDNGADRPLVPFALARTLYRSAPDDATQGFMQSHEGKLIMLRAGIAADDIDIFLNHRAIRLSASEFSIEIPSTSSGQDPQSYPHVYLADYAVALYDQDKEFANFLFGHGIQKKDFKAISEWIAERELSHKRSVRWWSRDKLGRIPGLGKNWAYGQIYYLEEYCRDIPYADEEYDTHSVYGTKELEELEAVLVKNKGANAFLVGDDKEEQIQIIARLNKMIEDGTVLPELEHKRIALFDNELLTSTAHTKADLETKLLQLIHEAEYAGNIIFVVSDFPALLEAGKALGSDIVALLDRYFTSPNMQVVGLSDVGRFHTFIEPDTALLQRFEKILMQPIDESNTVKVLENELIKVEYQLGVFFTYPALLAIADSAMRYFPDALMPDKAIDILLEVGPKLAERGKKIVRKADVLELIVAKTGIPVGEIKEVERGQLLNMEKILDQRIIGQEEAVKAISNAVRRARSGINNPNRPLASFLFLGPTGVGKTETTKALANIFFGADAKIERLDMSEYSSADSISKLIGSFESGKPGVLSTMLREHPYGVLLLDEFEKTTPEVMNLFLSILDEGMFSDMGGKKINARNLLIIATSNAGADIIWEGLKQGDDFSQAKDFIVNEIIRKGSFKPELVNRFDGVIIFHPLGKSELEKVAKLQLERLQKRLFERGINLVINDDLVKYVSTFGIDPKFGARPMNRAIQDNVEQAVAEKIIRGDFAAGQAVTLTLAELKK